MLAAESRRLNGITGTGEVTGILVYWTLELVLHCLLFCATFNPKTEMEMVMSATKLYLTHKDEATRLTGGIYTLPDAAKLLRIDLRLLRRWVAGYPADPVLTPNRQASGLGSLQNSGVGRDRYFGFLTLIEIFTAYQLRTRGFSMQKLRRFRNELAERFETDFPFALKGLLSSRRELLKEMGDCALLQLGTGGQTAFEKVLQPFCEKIEFDSASKLAAKLFPVGRESSIVVDPRHAFGQPVILGTNVTTEAIALRLRAGETECDLASDFDLTEQQVKEVRNFELALAA